jgi:exopolysaccharide production protein ExoZ
MDTVKRKLVGIQALRAVAACGVVASHLAAFEGKYVAGPALSSPVWLYGMSGVDLFFVISGFIITTMCAGRFGLRGEGRSFLLERATRIYPAYWVWSLAILAVFLVRPEMVNSHHGRPDILRSFLLLPQENLPLLLVAWTLVFEMFFYLLFSVALRWMREADLPRVLAVWAVIVAAGNLILQPTQNEPMLSLVFSPLLLEFILGCCVALYVGAVGRRAGFALLFLGIAGFAAGITAMGMLGEEFPLGWGRVLIFGTSSALIVAGMVGIERNGFNHVPRPLVALGDASYSLYLCHVPVIAVAGLAWHRLIVGSAPGFHVAALVWAFAIAIAAGFVSYHVIERPLLRLSRRLSRVAIRSPIRYGTVSRSGDPA